MSDAGKNADAGASGNGKQTLIDVYVSSRRKLFLEYLKNVDHKEELYLDVQNEITQFGTDYRDSVYGQIKIHPILIRIIDTPEFQRLRKIKQLGVAEFVFAGAAHSRFEHSIGVSHIAGMMVQSLARKQADNTTSDIKIVRRDILCVMVAGLVHDLGHGPFSHTWQFYMNRVEKKAGKLGTEREPKWEHEKASEKIFDRIWKNDEAFFTSCGLNDDDLKFIKEMIDPASDNKLEGRPSKPFLYDIVANKPSGVDVDKWDYLARDSLQVNVSNSFDFRRLVDNAMVIKVDEGDRGKSAGYKIAFRDKEFKTIADMFRVRLDMHQRVYQHRVERVLDNMLIDAFTLADKHVKLIDRTGKPTISPTKATTGYDLDAFLQLNDGSIITLIEHGAAKADAEPELQEAAAILDRIKKRDFYALIGQSSPTAASLNEEGTLSKLNEIAKANTVWNEHKLEFLVFQTKVDLGKMSKPNDFLGNVWFYRKDDPTEAFPQKPDKITRMLPQNVEEKRLFIYCKNVDVRAKKEKREAAADIVQKWAKENGYEVNVIGERTTTNPEPESLVDG